MCQPDWFRGYPDICLNIISGCAWVKLAFDLVGLKKVAYPPPRGWVGITQFVEEGPIKQKGRGKEEFNPSCLVA